MNDLWKAIIKAWNEERVENVVMHKHYSVNWTKERGPEHIPYK